MAKPLLVLALARSKTAQRLVMVVLGFVAAGVATMLLPLIAVPVLAAQSQSDTDPKRPTVVGEWGHPFAGDYTKSRGFGWDPGECATCGERHNGYDMWQGCGSQVFAAGPGVVVIAGAWGSYGNAVRIDHGGGVSTIYGHFLWDSLMVQSGETVTAGTPIGLEGTTGRSTGCHVHFELRIDEARVDPASFMIARGVPLK